MFNIFAEQFRIAWCFVVLEDEKLVFKSLAIHEQSIF